MDKWRIAECGVYPWMSGGLLCVVYIYPLMTGISLSRILFCSAAIKFKKYILRNIRL